MIATTRAPIGIYYGDSTSESLRSLLRPHDLPEAAHRAPVYTTRPVKPNLPE